MCESTCGPVQASAQFPVHCDGTPAKAYPFFLASKSLEKAGGAGRHCEMPKTLMNSLSWGVALLVALWLRTSAAHSLFSTGERTQDTCSKRRGEFIHAAKLRE